MKFFDENVTADGSALEPIAIVGMACRLPGSVDSTTKFWDLLKEQRSVRTPKVPSNRFNIDAHYHPDLARPGSFSALGGYFLDGNLEDFDASFFGMTPVEAMWLDPQQRKMLEVSYECLESAGLSLESVAGTNTGVYVASFTSDYQQMSTVERDFRHNYAATGVDVGIISNRINNTFNLNGPSFTINTACSSSVYAIHNACHALRAGDCEAAIAGGVNLILTVDQHMNTAKLGVLSPTSECHTFDASADGYGRAEGAGALYLKRLSDAVRDKDVIRGVIRSSAVNTNGKVPGMGITFPNVNGQEAVVRKAYNRADLDPNETAYLECHGTGTPAGDPIEVRAVSNAMNDTRSEGKPLLLGAVKANIGHSEAASGIFATMKAALMTEKALIPGVYGLRTLNPNIKDKEWNVKIATELTPWPASFDVRRASVSSFGYGGTNAHLIIESVESVCPWYEHGKPKALAQYDYVDAKRPFILTMSAHDTATLHRNITEYGKVVSDYHLPDLAYTLNCRRTKFTQRGYTIALSGSESSAFEPDNFTFGSKLEEPVVLGFIFTGQGAQWARMGYEAMQSFHDFAETIDSLDRILQRVCPDAGWTLREVLEAPAERSRVGEAEISQPACTAIQIAIVDLFASWGIQPSVTIGHSSGEIGAAYASGRISAPQAILAAFFRGYTVKRSAPVGTMLAVGLGAAKVVEYFPASVAERVTIACENSPNSVTLSGTSEDIALVKMQLDEAKVFARELRTGKAYHSPQMNAVAPLYTQLYSEAEVLLTNVDLTWRRPLVDMISSVTTSALPPSDLPISYWCENLRNRVLFNGAIQTLKSGAFARVNALVEIGPHAVLGGPIKQICLAQNFEHLSYTASLVRGTDSATALLRTAGELFLKGIDVDLDLVNIAKTPASSPTAAVHSKKRNTPQFIPDLPPYQWNYDSRLWFEPRVVEETRQSKHERHDILGRRIFGLSTNASTWKNVLRQRDVPWFQDHRLGPDVVFPAAGHLSLATEALLQHLDLDPQTADGVDFRYINISKALLVPDTDEGIEVHTRLEEGVDGWSSFTVESTENGIWTIHSKGLIRKQHSTDSPRQQGVQWPYELSQLHQQVRGARWYQSFDRVGFNYGKHMQTMKNVRANGKDRAAAANVHIRTDCSAMVQESRYMLHPSTIDGCLHVVIASVHKGLHKEMPWGVVPLEIEEMSINFPGHDNDTEGQCVAWTDRTWDRYFNENVQLAGPSGNRLLSIKNLKLVVYDAAIPATLTENRPKEPYRQVVWESASFLEPAEEFAEDVKTALLCAGEPLEKSRELSTSLGATLVPFDSEDALEFDRLVVDDVDGRILAEVSTESFTAIKRILSSGKSIIWLTCGANQGESVSSGIAQSFLRAVRSELVSLRVSLIDVDLEVCTDEICTAIEDQFMQNLAKDSGNDVEFWLREDGSLHVPRLMPSTRLNNLIFGTSEYEMASLGTDLSYHGSIVDGELRFEAERVGDNLASGQVEILHSFVEIHRDDLRSPGDRPRIMTGTVTRVGADQDPSFIGQQVVAFTDKAFETKSLVTTFVPIDVEDGGVATATLPYLCKVVDAVLRNGQAKKGDHMLVISATKQFASAVDALAQHFGFHVSHLENDADSVSNAISSVTPPKLVVSDTASPATLEAWRHLGRRSRLVISDATIDTPLDPRPFAKGAVLSMCGISYLYENDSVALNDVLTTAVDLLIKMQLPVSIKPPLVLDVEELLDAEGVRVGVASGGDLVLHYQYGQSMVKFQTKRSELRFPPDSAYLLVGCLGGLGRSLTTWMLERGCRDFVFLSRSGTAKAEAADVVAQLEQAGASVEVFKVDAADKKAVADVVTSVSSTRPIRGVIHAAMVLQDGLFEGMTANKYNAVLRPKMQGAIALHEALGDTPLDFFIMTSSLSAVLGNPGQANYCAGNAYLDFLALHRRKHGLAACSIALPMVEDVGVVAENASIADSLTRKNPFCIDEREMLLAFEAGILQSTLTDGEDVDMGTAQLVLGLEPEVMVTAMETADMSDAYWLNDARISSVRKAVDELLTGSGGQKQGQGGAGLSFVASLAGLDECEILAAIGQHIINRSARILGYPPEKFKLEGASVASHGVDSMIGVELQTWLFKELSLELSVQVLSNPTTTFASLARMAAENLGVVCEA